jgi:hypothetical protein
MKRYKSVHDELIMLKCLFCCSEVSALFAPITSNVLLNSVIQFDGE